MNSQDKDSLYRTGCLNWPKIVMNLLFRLLKIVLNTQADKNLSIGVWK